VLTVAAPHAAAVNAALGEALASVVVVEDAPTAAEAVRRFREERVGLVSSLILDLVS
jgi:chromosome segregation ATPase|tara:strand:- start:116 stop:286 length:171 start_codon:yes stop_codon:yes gene_type:complete